MKTVCEKNKCNGCMACLEKCHKNAITVKDDLEYYNAIIDETLCVNCGKCSDVCPNNSDIEKLQPQSWYQGWADNSIRLKSSSGGAASSIIKAFIEDGGYVASCMFNEGEFSFDVTNSIETAKKFAGSKYVKSNPAGIYGKIDKLLKDGEKVLFIGLPCQVSALKNFVKNKENLVTADLICHGTPSPVLLEKCLSEYGYDIKNLSDIKFRINGLKDINDGRQNIAPLYTMDSYLIAFLHSFDYTENCYSCKFATTDRVSDITLGDSWGTEYTNEVKDGVSLIMCQSEKGRELIEKAGLKLFDVDVDNAVSHNDQLRGPSNCGGKNFEFFANVRKYNSFKKALVKTVPNVVMKEKLKSLIKIIIRRGKTQAYLITVSNKKEQ